MKRRLRVPALVTLLVAAIGISACGDSDSSTTTQIETVSVSTPAVTEPAATEEESGTPTESAGGEKADGAAPPADQTVTTPSGFTSPTGNIGCYIDPESVRCDIQDRSWAPPPPPADCQLDYGQGIELRAGGEADFVCAGDTTLGGGEPLPYGTSIGAGLIRCESEESGMTCRDVETGRGFTMSKDAYEIF